MKPTQQYRLGVLGGGQLAQMLIEAAQRLELNPILLARDSKEPAAQISLRTVYGDVENAQTLKAFLKAVDLVTFESEFHPCHLLQAAADGLGVQFLPGLQAMSLLQDKLNQKVILERLAVSTSKYKIFMPESDLMSWVSEMLELFGGECVFKWARLGYDGKGTFFGNRENTSEAFDFCFRAISQNIPIYAEEKITLKRELAMVACYSTRNEFASYPLVISQQKNGICHRVLGPATSLGVATSLEQQAREIMQKLAEKLSLYGSFAIEFFETTGEKLLVNEIAPRVHNTGHYSLDAAHTSQFENHWRAILGMPLGKTDTHPLFGMLNLLGPANLSTRSLNLSPPTLSNVHLHWYGKSEIRPGRKLGHLNATEESPDRINALNAALDSSHERWLKGILK